MKGFFDDDQFFSGKFFDMNDHFGDFGNLDNFEFSSNMGGDFGGGRVTQSSKTVQTKIINGKRVTTTVTKTRGEDGKVKVITETAEDGGPKSRKVEFLDNFGGKQSNKFIKH